MFIECETIIKFSRVSLATMRPIQPPLTDMVIHSKWPTCCTWHHGIQLNHHPTILQPSFNVFHSFSSHSKTKRPIPNKRHGSSFLQLLASNIQTQHTTIILSKPPGSSLLQLIPSNHSARGTHPSWHWVSIAADVLQSKI